MAVNELNTRIAQYLFAPHRWANEQKVVATMQHKPQFITQVSDGLIDLVAKSMKPDVLPPFFEEFANRLVLLDKDEWEDLALCVALLPYSGKISRSMDGYFRSAVKNLISPDVVSQVDQLQLEDKPSLAGNWIDVSSLTQGAIASVMDACHWSEPVKDYTLLRFKEELPVANIKNLTISHIEVACKISLPNHSWLLS